MGEEAAPPYGDIPAETGVTFIVRVRAAEWIQEGFITTTESESSTVGSILQACIQKLSLKGVIVNSVDVFLAEPYSDSHTKDNQLVALDSKSTLGSVFNISRSDNQTEIRRKELIMCRASQRVDELQTNQKHDLSAPSTPKKNEPLSLARRVPSEGQAITPGKDDSQCQVYKCTHSREEGRAYCSGHIQSALTATPTIKMDRSNISIKSSVKMLGSQLNSENKEATASSELVPLPVAINDSTPPDTKEHASNHQRRRSTEINTDNILNEGRYDALLDRFLSTRPSL